MKQTIVWVLVAANVSLAGTLAWRGIGENAARAQAGNNRQPPPPAAADVQGKYTLIPGDSQVGVSVIYVFDAANRRLGAIAPDAKDVMTAMPVVMLQPVFDSLSTGGIRQPGEDGPPNNRRPNNPPRNGGGGR